MSYRNSFARLLPDIGLTGLMQLVLDEFYVDAEGQLDRLVLQGVARRPISADKPGVEVDVPESRFYAVDGDSFVLRYNEAITLNIQYVRLTPEDAEMDDASRRP